MKLILILLLTLTVGIINNSNQETDKALLEKIEKLENELNELKQWKENIINKRKKRYDVESDIIDKKDYLDLLYGRLENNIYLKHKHFYLKRIYNSQKDGRCLKDLYSKCDKKKMIFLVFESEEGIKFGGFIQDFTVGYSKETKINEHNYNNEDFVFSLDKMQVYNAIYNYDFKEYYYYSSGHLFIEKDFLQFNGAFFFDEDNDKCFLDHCISGFLEGNQYWGGILTILPSNVGKTYHSMKLLEAFQVIIDKNE